MNQNLISVNEMVSIEGGEVKTTSYQVAKFFGKRHDNIIRAIENVKCSMPFAKLNFEVCHENNELQNGKPRKFYRMTKNGFIFLVMGFTGEKADRLKEAYINAFDWMYAQLANGKDKLIKELQETIKLERISFQNGSVAGKALNQRKKEKMAIQAKLRRIEEQFKQPDLFLAA